ncbi:DUF6348 family protein [Wukongibacter baidiensis]|uniref:DUF6348 family protein n=1 Tax=Wukongibacter baidiensis TaxID=1723361 RepID=UPI003D7FF6FA
MWPFKRKKTPNKSDAYMIIETLANVVPNGEIVDGKLLIKDIDLWVSVESAVDKGPFIQADIIIHHDIFEENIFESLTGIGHSKEDKIEQIVSNFSFSSLCAITKALRDEEGEMIDITYYDRVNKFKLFKSCLSTLGDQQGYEVKDYWDMIGSEISKRMGNKKIYYIKIYASKSQSSIICECRINGIVNKEITSLLNDNASMWNTNDILYSEKQCFVLIHDNATYKPYKYSKQELKIITEKAIIDYTKCDTYEKHRDYNEELYKSTKDLSLACELYLFIPEIVCELICDDATFVDSVVIFKNNSQITMYKEQITSYNTILECVYEMINTGKLDQKQIKHILLCSSSYKAIYSALQQGGKMNDFKMKPLEIDVPSKYMPI